MPDILLCISCHEPLYYVYCYSIRKLCDECGGLKAQAPDRINHDKGHRQLALSVEQIKLLYE